MKKNIPTVFLFVVSAMSLFLMSAGCDKKNDSATETPEMSAETKARKEKGGLQTVSPGGGTGKMQGAPTTEVQPK